MAEPAEDLTEDVLTVEEAAEFLKISRSGAYEYIRQGVIPHRRVGKRILLSRRGLLAWLESGGEPQIRHEWTPRCASGECPECGQ